MGTIQEGAKQAIVNCCRLKPKEKVVIISDQRAHSVSKALVKEAKKITDSVVLFVMEDFGRRPINFPKVIGEAMMKADLSIYAATDRPYGEIKTFRTPMLNILQKNKKLRHAHMIGIEPKTMRSGMNVDYRVVQKLTDKVKKVVEKAKQIRVTTKLGTDMTFDLLPKQYRWTADNGLVRRGELGNLPSGEVFTCPHVANGRMVIDGCVGDNLLLKYGNLRPTPITVEVKKSRAIRASIKSDNKKLQKDFRQYLFRTDKNSNRVGELGIGTNVGIKRIIANLVQAEKFPGVHVAFGHPFPDHTGAKWKSDGHIDCIMRKTTVEVDGKVIMKDGKYTL